MTTPTPMANGEITLAAAEQLDRRKLRDVLGRFATGVTVVTVGGSQPHGMTANAFTSVSLTPPLVLVCVSHTARLHKELTHQDGFGVSVLAADQADLARYFASGDRPAGAAQFASVDWSPGQFTGAPLLHGAAAWLECTVTQTYAGGDHSIVLGQLMSVAGGAPGRPLVFHAGQFHQLGERMRDGQGNR
jgi:flavin reductase (DIM6/NTAB) family NADH-FMN oxidoreductase RutF